MVLGVFGWIGWIHPIDQDKNRVNYAVWNLKKKEVQENTEVAKPQLQGKGGTKGKVPKERKGIEVAASPS